MAVQMTRAVVGVYLIECGGVWDETDQAHACVHHVCHRRFECALEQTADA
jgi:hypothetical protein